MILICRTSVTSAAVVERLQPMLDWVVGASGKWSFDLEDCDRVLRVEADVIAPEEIFDVFHKAGFECEELEDVEVVCKYVDQKNFGNSCGKVIDVQIRTASRIAPGLSSDQMRSQHRIREFGKRHGSSSE